MKRLFLCGLILLASCGVVPTTPTSTSNEQVIGATSANMLRIKTILSKDEGISSTLALLNQSRITVDESRAITDSDGKITTALIPTSDPDYFIFISNIYSTDVEGQLLHISDRTEDSNTLTTTYLTSKIVVRTTINSKTQKIIHSAIGKYASAQKLSDLSVIEAKLSALETAACSSARQALVSANLGLAAATIAYGAALAACVAGPWCLPAVLGAQLALAAAGANVNSARYNVEANC